MCFKCRQSVSVLAVLVPGLAVSSLMLLRSREQVAMTNPYHRAGRTLLSTTDSEPPIIDVHDTEFLIGYVLGCVSAAFYVGSRLPQIFKNVSPSVCACAAADYCSCRSSCAAQWRDCRCTCLCWLSWGTSPMASESSSTLWTTASSSTGCRGWWEA